VRIDGNIKGDIDALVVFIGIQRLRRDGWGDINTKVIMVYGLVEGNTNASENIEIMPKSGVDGDIKTNILNYCRRSVFLRQMFNDDKINRRWSRKEVMNFLRKHMRIIFVVTIVTFIGSSFAGVVYYFFNFKKDFKTFVVVNGVKIPEKLFNLMVYTDFRQMTNEQQLYNEDLKELKTRIIYSLVQDEILYQQSKLYGIIVTDEELRNDLRNSAKFEDNNVFNIRKYHVFLNSVQMTAKEYEAMRRKQIAAAKVKMLISSCVKVWNYELENALKQESPITKNALIQSKINFILNEWYSDIVRNSKITVPG
jgi:hypothetical protein